MIGRTTRSKHPGYSELDTYSTGIYTEQLSNYEKELHLQEDQIFTVSNETEILIENLNKMESDANEA